MKLHRVLLSVALMASLACAAGAATAGVGTRLGWWEFGAGFGVLRWSVYLVALPVGLALASAVVARASGARLTDIRYALVLGINLVVLGVPYYHLNEFRKIPTLADATTNFAEPPVFVDLVPLRAQTAANPLTYRGAAAAELQREYFPGLVTLHTTLTPAHIVQTAAAAARDMGLQIIAERPEEGRMEAVATSLWFGFRDDVVLRARPLQNGQTQVDLRSASRVGGRDGGANARRIQQLLQRLTTAAR